MRDLRDKSDVATFIHFFYQKITTDARIKHLFEHIEGLEAHEEVIVSFWEGIVFGTSDYRGNVMQKHLQLHHDYGLKAADFEVWLYTFEKSFDACGFAGTNVDTMIQRANMIASHMKYKIESSGTSLI